MQQCHKILKKTETEGGIIECVGKPGYGITYCMAKICRGMVQNSKSRNNNSTIIVPIFTENFGSGAGKLNMAKILRYIKDCLTTYLGMKNNNEETEKILLIENNQQNNIKSLTRDVCSLLESAPTLVNISNFKLIGKSLYYKVGYNWRKICKF